MCRRQTSNNKPQTTMQMSQEPTKLGTLEQRELPRPPFIMIGIFLILEQWTGILAFVMALISWRFFGALLQQYVTTRPARPREIESGLTAGRELLERYQTGVGIHASGWRRVWNMGLLQVAFGFTLIWLLMYFGQGLIRPESLEAMWFNHYFMGS